MPAAAPAAPAPAAVAATFVRVTVTGFARGSLPNLIDRVLGFDDD
jgi:hypothetical protein